MSEFKKTNIISIKQIIDNCNNGKKTFRYFDKRPYEIVENHLVSEVYWISNEPAAYYHIEQEKDIYWFGIIVSDSYVGKGISKIIMKRAIEKSNNYNIDLHLSVDKTNEIAFNLYKKNKFNIVKETDLYYIMKRDKGA